MTDAYRENSPPPPPPITPWYHTKRRRRRIIAYGTLFGVITSCAISYITWGVNGIGMWIGCMGALLLITTVVEMIELYVGRP